MWEVLGVIHDGFDTAVDEDRNRREHLETKTAGPLL